MTAKRIFGNPDSNRAISRYQVIGQTDRLVIDHGGGFGYLLEVIKYTQVRCGGIFQDIAFIGNEDDHGFGIGPFFEIIYFLDRFGVGSVATDTPDRVGGIQDQVPLPEFSETAFNIVGEVVFHVSFLVR